MLNVRKGSRHIQMWIWNPLVGDKVDNLASEPDTPEYIFKETRREIRGYVKGLKMDGVPISLVCFGTKSCLPQIKLRDNVTEFRTIREMLIWLTGLDIGHHLEKS